MEKRWQALLQERADLVKEGDQLLTSADTDARTLTTEEDARYGAINTRLTALAGEIETEQKMREHRRATASAESAVAQSAPAITGGHNRGADRPWGADTGAPLGEMLLAIRNQRLGGASDPRLFAAVQGAGEVIGEDGGFLVHQDQITDLSKAINSGALLSRVNRIPLRAGSNGVSIAVVNETSRAAGSRWGAVQGYWVDEGTSITASRPKFAKVDLKLSKVAALGYSGDELLEDASAFERVITDAFRDELQFLVEDAIVNGTGAGQPSGILGAAATVSVAKETGQAAATVVTKNLSKMWARFLGRNPVWFINRDVNPELDELSIPAGTGALEPRFVTYGSDGLMRIKGAPVVEIEYAATLGTKGDIILADMSAYGYIDGGGVKQAQSMHVAFATDEMAFRATLRVDGQVMPRAALTPFKGTGNTRSPFVVLDTRA